MKSRKSSSKRAHRRRHQRDAPEGRARRLLSVRSALIFELALLTAVGGAILLHDAHRPVEQIALSCPVIFAAAIKLFDSMIE